MDSFNLRFIMQIHTGFRFKGAIKTVFRGKTPIFALALAGAGIQGCTTEDSPISPVTEASPPAELAAAAQTASASGTQAANKDIGGGCKLHSIREDAGSRIRANTRISCDKQQREISFAGNLDDASYHRTKSIMKECKNVYWCGTGNVYLDDRAGLRFYILTIIGEANHDKAGGLTLKGWY